MTLKSPFIITARLLPGLKIGQSFVSIEFSKRPGDGGRARYNWFIDGPDRFEAQGDDLQSGCQGGSLQGGMESLLSFMDAAASAYRHSMSGRESDNADLFPADVMEWCYQNEMEIQMARCDLEADKELIAD